MMCNTPLRSAVLIVLQMQLVVQVNSGSKSDQYTAHDCSGDPVCITVGCWQALCSAQELELVCTHADTAGTAWHMLMQAPVLGLLDSTERCQAFMSPNVLLCCACVGQAVQPRDCVHKCDVKHRS